MTVEPPSPAAMRRDYTERAELRKNHLAGSWTSQFAAWFADAMSQIGGRVLIVRPAPSGAAGAADEDGFAAMAAGWNAVGAATAERGVRTLLRFDFLSSLRIDDGWERLLDAVDPALVGVALDTGELAAAGRDPLAELLRLGSRVDSQVGGRHTGSGLGHRTLASAT